MMFTPIACKPYRPCTKGRIENVAKIMDRLKAYNEEFEDYDDLNNIVKNLNEKLNSDEKSQATGQYPKVLFEQKEKEYLSKVNLDQFNYSSSRQVRKVSNESMINVNNNKYSVPVEYLGELVEIQIKDDQLYIYYNDELIRQHKLEKQAYRLIYNKSDVKEIIKSNYPSYSDNQIEAMANKRLEGFDILLNRNQRSKE